MRSFIGFGFCDVQYVLLKQFDFDFSMYCWREEMEAASLGLWALEITARQLARCPVVNIKEAVG